MDYFVSIENTPYYHWQIELLLESFKQHGCQDNLMIAMAEGKSHNYDFCRDLFSHKRTYQHENVGAVRGYMPINSLSSLAFSLRNKLISQPVVVLPPDVVMYRKPDIMFENYPQIFFAPDPFFTLDFAEEQVGPFWEWLDAPKKDFQDSWIPFGSVMLMANIPLELPYEVINVTELLVTQQLLAGREISNQTHILAWAIVFRKYQRHIRLHGDYLLVMPLLGSGNCPFISYDKGMPPNFSKAMFSYAPPHFSSFGNPFKVLAENHPSPNAYYLSQLARKCLDPKPQNILE